MLQHARVHRQDFNRKGNSSISNPFFILFGGLKLVLKMSFLNAHNRQLQENLYFCARH